MVGQQGQAPWAAVRRTRRSLPWIILGIGIVLSIVAFFLVRDWEEAIIRADFESLARTHTASVHRELSRHLDASAALAGLYAASQEVDPDEFERFASGLLNQHSDIQAIMWAPAVPAAAMPEWLRRAREAGMPNFQIVDRDAEGHAVPAAARDIYFPVFYLIPMRGNGDLLGVDVMTDPAYRTVLQNARDSGMVTASGPVRLTTDNEDHGLLLARALYHKKTPLDTVDQRRAGTVCTPALSRERVSRRAPKGRRGARARFAHDVRHGRERAVGVRTLFTFTPRRLRDRLLAHRGRAGVAFAARHFRSSMGSGVDAGPALLEEPPHLAFLGSFRGGHAAHDLYRILFVHARETDLARRIARAPSRAFQCQARK